MNGEICKPRKQWLGGNITKRDLRELARSPSRMSLSAAAGEPVYVPDNDDDLEDVVAAVENETASQTDSQQVQMQVCVPSTACAACGTSTDRRDGRALAGSDVHGDGLHATAAAQPDRTLVAKVGHGHHASAARPEMGGAGTVAKLEPDHARQQEAKVMRMPAARHRGWPTPTYSRHMTLGGGSGWPARGEWDLHAAAAWPRPRAVWLGARSAAKESSGGGSTLHARVTKSRKSQGGWRAKMLCTLPVLLCAQGHKGDIF